MTKSFFERKLRPLLTYVGTLGAIIMTVAYIIAIIVLIFGFESNIELKSVLVYAILNAAIGMLVMFFLKVQGKDFAKNLEENKPIIKAYYEKPANEKKQHTMVYFWVKTTLVDLLTKFATVVVTTTLVIRIVIEGNGDLGLLGFAAVNILMFLSFGFLSLVKAFDFYNEHQVPFMKNELRKQGIELKTEPQSGIIISEESEEEPHDGKAIS